MADRPTSRRSFLGLAGGAALLCTIGGEEVAVDGPAGLDRADAAAARVRRPRGAAAQELPQLQPAPGGVRRERWIQAESVAWDVVPTNRDDWHDRLIRGRTKFRAYVHREMTAGFAGPLGGVNIPGPTLEAEVGDVLVVHFRNADRELRQAVTMHPHGVRYSPEYDGAYMCAYTRAGGFVAPGETFTYQWECTPDSVGAWPYHDHGPNHTPNTFRGLFGTLVVRPKGARRPDVLYTQFAHQLPPPRGAFVDNPTVGPNETVTARFVEDNPGRWLYHCHVFSHRDTEMTGWYLVGP